MNMEVNMNLENNFISNYFTLREAQFSSIAERMRIDNTIPPALLPAIHNTAEMMDQVRVLLHFPIHVDSWYRCFALNFFINSAPTSQHLKGEAVDFVCQRFGSALDICKEIAKSDIEFDKLILEHSWVHISKQSNPAVKNRKEIYTLNKDVATKHQHPYLVGLVQQF